MIVLCGILLTHGSLLFMVSLEILTDQRVEIRLLLLLEMTPEPEPEFIPRKTSPLDETPQKRSEPWVLTCCHHSMKEVSNAPAIES